MLPSSSRSSLGFHTLTLSQYTLLPLDMDELLEDFKRYSRQTHSIQIYPGNHENTVVKFYKEDKGIEWSITHCIWYEPLKAFVGIIDVKINPKLLSGIHDYLTAATLDDMQTAITNFDNISKGISPLLGTFSDYELKRIDYCINFSVSELAPGCTSEQIMNLIRRGNIPRSYREWMKYDHTSHRMKASPASFYLMNKSVHINCYRKVVELQKRAEMESAKESPSITQLALDAAEDIVRFEVQCKYRNVYTRSRKAKANGNSDVNLYKDLLAPEVCVDRINYYYNKTVGKGHWYSLQTAISLVKSHSFNSQKESRLINALRFVNQCRSLAKAKALRHGTDLVAFKRSLKDLTDMGINPITIPREWGIGRIWNLLETYHNKAAMAHIGRQVEEELLQDKELMKQVIALT